ncbi:MAG: LPS assembly lipoprotein LptE [Pseudomonadota bacterium]
MKTALRALFICLLAATLAACGFKLRGPQTLPFDTIAVPGVTTLRTEIKRAIQTQSNAKVVENVNDADAVLDISREASEKVILSLTTRGRVREYQLRYLVSYRVTRKQGGVYVPPTTVLLTRDITFNDEILAKETEEQQLYAEMRADFVQQLMRRLAAAKPLLPDEY